MADIVYIIDGFYYTLKQYKSKSLFCKNYNFKKESCRVGRKFEINTKRLNRWRNRQETSYINTSTIVVTHPVHLETNTVNFNGKINKLSLLNGEIIPLIVKEQEDGMYQLLFGLKQLITAKLRDEHFMPCVVVNHSTREDLVSYINDKYNIEEMFLCPIDEIEISQQFADTTPNPKKIEKKSKEIEDGLIPLITVNKNKTLIDGYITYLLLKDRGDENVSIKIMN